jgi:hypothetical protein
MSQPAVESNPLAQDIAQRLRGVQLTGRPFGSYSDPVAVQAYSHGSANTLEVNVRATVSVVESRPDATDYYVMVELERADQASFDVSRQLGALKLVMDTDGELSGHTGFRPATHGPGRYCAVIKTSSAHIQPSTVLTVTA